MGGQKIFKSGQMWANISQSFGIIGILSFEFEGAHFMLFKKANLYF